MHRSTANSSSSPVNIAAFPSSYKQKSIERHKTCDQKHKDIYIPKCATLTMNSLHTTHYDVILIDYKLQINNDN